MLGSAAVMAFVSSTNLDTARTFYGNVLGLTVEDEDPFACVLRCAGVMLRVTKVDQLSPQPFTVLGWQVDDIRAAMTELARHGVGFVRYDGLGQDDDGVWTAPDGAQIVWFADPDGNLLSLTQFG